MSEYIFKIDGALFNEETGEAVMKPKFVERLTRCKDCKYYNPSFCEAWSKYGTIKTQASGFCFLAERKDNG